MTTNALTPKELAALKKNCRRYSDAQWKWAQSQWTAEQFRRHLRMTNEWSTNRVLSIQDVYSETIQHNCGVGNGTGVQGATVAHLNSGTTIHKAMLRHWLSNRKHVIVTCNDEQKDIYDKWIDYGFEVVKDWTKNPNTGRKIVVLMYTFPDSSELAEVAKKPIRRRVSKVTAA